VEALPRVTGARGLLATRVLAGRQARRTRAVNIVARPHARRSLASKSHPQRLPGNGRPRLDLAYHVASVTGRYRPASGTNAGQGQAERRSRWACARRAPRFELGTGVGLALLIGGTRPRPSTSRAKRGINVTVVPAALPESGGRYPCGEPAVQNAVIEEVVVAVTCDPAARS